MSFEEQRDFLLREREEYKNAIMGDLQTAKQEFNEKLQTVLIASGAVLLGYLAVKAVGKMIESDPPPAAEQQATAPPATQQPPAYYAPPPREESSVVRMIKEQLAMFILAFAKEKLAEFLEAFSHKITEKLSERIDAGKNEGDKKS